MGLHLTTTKIERWPILVIENLQAQTVGGEFGLNEVFEAGQGRDYGDRGIDLLFEVFQLTLLGADAGRFDHLRRLGIQLIGLFTLSLVFFIAVATLTVLARLAWLLQDAFALVGQHV